jgi:hypothetical protein
MMAEQAPAVHVFACLGTAVLQAGRAWSDLTDTLAATAAQWR